MTWYVSQEDAQGVAITSYQGDHIENFKYPRKGIHERGFHHVNIYGGGGGTIVPQGIEEFQCSGIDCIFSPDDGGVLGLQGMINEVVKGCDFGVSNLGALDKGSYLHLAQTIPWAEESGDVSSAKSAASRSAAVPNAARFDHDIRKQVNLLNTHDRKWPDPDLLCDYFSSSAHLVGVGQ